MLNDDSPVDGSKWGAWNREASNRWEVVRRSWTIFALNTDDLIQHLDRPAFDPLFSLDLMGDDHTATAPCWDTLDQRLHNQLAGAVSLVDHTRRLTDYYTDDFPQLAKEFEARNKEVMPMDRAAFLRRLRNYLLHYGAAPIIQTFNLGPVDPLGVSGHSIKLGALHLLVSRV